MTHGVGRNMFGDASRPRIFTDNPLDRAWRQAHVVATTIARGRTGVADKQRCVAVGACFEVFGQPL